jgi:hypothetical protein
MTVPDVMAAMCEISRRGVGGYCLQLESMKKIKLTRKQKKLLLFIGLPALLLLVASVVALRSPAKPDEPPQPVYSQLTGAEVEPDVAERPVLGVMIENSEEARPQTGLDSAGIVFEATTEGGITRYLALYQEDMPEIVGPVRSLRPHFLDWAMGFDASIAHVGGSPEALELADERDAKSLNEFKYSQPYYRDNSREAPHNMYARTEDLRNLQAELEHQRSQFADIPRTDESPSQNPQADSITLDFSSPPFVVRFRYDQSSNSYTRHLAGEPQIDSATNQPITVKNVIVIKTNGDKATGDGKALVFKNGNVTEARWKKTSHRERIKVLGDDGNEIPLNRGSTWIAVIRSDRPVTY